MFYNKPKDVTYTDMAIWIDANAYTPNCDYEKLYIYVYHLARMLAYKHSYFDNAQDYDDFSLYVAGQMYKRYTLANQVLEYSQDGLSAAADGFLEVTDSENQPRQMSKVKSVLNYVTKSLYFFKTHYLQWAKTQTYQKLDDPVPYSYDSWFSASMRDAAAAYYRSDYLLYLEDIPKTLIDSLKNIPHRKNSAEFQNITISCLLSFLNVITLKNRDLKILDQAVYSYDNRFMQFYAQNRKDYVILYHLDESYRDYIYVLVNRVMTLIRNDLRHIMEEYIPVNDLIYDVLDYYNGTGDYAPDDQQ